MYVFVIDVSAKCKEIHDFEEEKEKEIQIR